MNNPITEGAVFKHTWIKWKKLPKLCKYDYLVAYCDPSFKGTSKNDYKAIKLWGKIGTELHQIEAFVRQCSVAEMVRWWYDLHERMIVAGVILLHRGEFPARHHPRRIYPRGEFTRVPATHTGGQTQEAGQVPAHRGNLPAVGARVRVLQRRQAERPRHARGTGTDPRV